MSKRAKIAVGVLVLVLVLGVGAMALAPSGASAQVPPAERPTTEGRAPRAGEARTVVGTYADGSPVYGTGTSADKAPAAVAARAATAATKEGGRA